MHEGMLVSRSSYRFETSHPAHIAFVWVSDSERLCEVAARVLITGSIVHMIALIPRFDYLPRVMILLRTSRTSDDSVINLWTS